MSLRLDSVLVALLCLTFQQDSDTPGVSTSFPQAGIAVTIDPESLFRGGLRQVWQYVNESIGTRKVASKPYSKVHFKVRPVPALDRAVLNLELNGVAVGESASQWKSAQLITDSLTRFEARQVIEISPAGIGFSEPHIELETKQTYNRAIAGKHPFTSLMARSAFNRFPRDAEVQARQFARRQIENDLRQSNVEMARRLERWGAMFESRYPYLAQMGWHLCSDQDHVYLVSLADLASGKPGDVLLNSQSSRAPRDAIRVAINSAVAADYLAHCLSGKKFSHRQIESFYQACARNIQIPPLTHPDENPWSIRFGSRPAQVNFSDNQIKLAMHIDQFESADRQLPPAAVSLNYDIRSDAEGCFLQRQDIEITGGGGARQKAVRSILRTRLQRVIPHSIALPDSSFKNSLSTLGISLRLEQVITADGCLVIAIASQ